MIKSRLRQGITLGHVSLALALAVSWGVGEATAQVWDGDAGGMTFALAVDPSSPGTVYAGTARGGVFKSTDGGKSWCPVHAEKKGARVRALVLDTGGKPSRVYAGLAGGGLLKSADAGKTWGAVEKGPEGREVWSLAVDSSTNPSTVYAGTAGGKVFESVDEGKTWRVTGAGMDDKTVRALAVDVRSRPSTIYAGTDGALYVRREADSKKDWTKIFSSGVIELAIDSTQPATVFAGSHRALLRSTDGGKTWKKVRPVKRLWSLGIDETRSPVTVYLGTAYQSVLRSTDGGETWDEAHKGLPRWGEVLALAVDSRTAPTTVYAATSHRGVHRSTDGAATWHKDSATCSP